MMKFNCPHCEAALKVPESKAGIEQPCPACKEIVKAPIPIGMESLNVFIDECEQEHREFVEQPREVPVAQVDAAKSRVHPKVLEFCWWVSIIVVALVIHAAIMQVYVKFTIKRELNKAAQDVQQQLDSIFQ